MGVGHPLTWFARTNYTNTGSTFWPDYTINFCEITFLYSHQNQNDSTGVNYWMPTLAAFENRFLATVGAANNINNGSGAADTGGAISLGAVGGLTDACFPY